MPSAQQMQMQVLDRLPAIVAGVDDDAEALRQVSLSYESRSLQQVTEQRIGRSRDVGKVLLGNHQQMGGRLRDSGPGKPTCARLRRLRSPEWYGLRCCRRYIHSSPHFTS